MAPVNTAERIFSSPKRPGGFWGPPKPPNQWVSRYAYPGLKRPGPEADYLSPYGAEIKWSYASTLPICPNGDHRDNFNAVIKSLNEI